MRGKALLWKTLKVSALDKLGGKKKSTWEQSEFSLTVSPAQPHAVLWQEFSLTVSPATRRVPATGTF